MHAPYFMPHFMPRVTLPNADGRAFAARAAEHREIGQRRHQCDDVDETRHRPMPECRVEPVHYRSGRLEPKDQGQRNPDPPSEVSPCSGIRLFLRHGPGHYLPSALPFASRSVIRPQNTPASGRSMVDWDKHYATRAGRMAASEIRELLKLLDQPDVISFAGGIPDPELFPRAAIAAAYRRILGDPVRGAAALQYSASEGYLPLREWIAGYMAGLAVARATHPAASTRGRHHAAH